MTEDEVKLARLNQALSDFGAWSNYMVITTTAAVAWGAHDGGNRFMKFGITMLAASTVLGILTLSLVPLVRQSLTPDKSSIYQVSVSWSRFGCGGTAKLETFCVWQHVLFAVGLLLYSIAVFN